MNKIKKEEKIRALLNEIRKEDKEKIVKMMYLVLLTRAFQMLNENNTGENYSGVTKALTAQRRNGKRRKGSWR